MSRRRGLDTAQREAIAQRRRQALELRLAGATYEQIAGQLGYKGGKGEAHNDITRALRESSIAMRERGQELLELELKRLDRIQLALWPKVLAGDTPATTTMLRLLDQRSKLLGLDAPIKHEVVTIDVLDAEIQRLEAEQRRRAAEQAGQAVPAQGAAPPAHPG